MEHQVSDSPLVSLLSAKGPFCTQLSAAAAADTTDLQAELISARTGPGAHPPWQSYLLLQVTWQRKERGSTPSDVSKWF